MLSWYGVDVSISVKPLSIFSFSVYNKSYIRAEFFFHKSATDESKSIIYINFLIESDLANLQIKLFGFILGYPVYFSKNNSFQSYRYNT